MLFRYEVRVSGQTPLCGDWEVHAGENRLVLLLPEGKLESVCARGKLWNPSAPGGNCPWERRKRSS